MKLKMTDFQIGDPNKTGVYVCVVSSKHMPEMKFYDTGFYTRNFGWNFPVHYIIHKWVELPNIQSKAHYLKDITKEIKE